MLRPYKHFENAKWLKIMRTLYYVLYGLIIVLFGLIWYHNYETIGRTGQPYQLFAPNEQWGMLIQYFVIGYTLAVIPGVLYWMKRACRKIAKIEDEALRYDTYYTYADIRIGAIAIAVLFSLLAYWLLGAYKPMLWLAAIGAVALVFAKPTAAKTEEELRPQDESIPTY